MKINRKDRRALIAALVLAEDVLNAVPDREGKIELPDLEVRKHLSHESIFNLQMLIPSIEVEP